jgi:hypothetical protein
MTAHTGDQPRGGVDGERGRHAIVGDIRADLYRGLVAAGHRRDLSALLVVRGVHELSPRGQELLSALAGSLVAHSSTSEWPGSRMQDAEASVNQYALTEATTAMLAAAAGGLYDWMAPKLPEDLCFIRPDGTPWLVSVAHERDAYVLLSQTEAVELLAELPALGAHLDSPIGTVEIRDDEVGPIWIRFSVISGSGTARLSLSLRRSWDVDLLIDAEASAELAAALSHDRVSAVNARTVDGEPATVHVDAGRLRIVVPEFGLDDAIALDAHVASLAAFLDQAGRRARR